FTSAAIDAQSSGFTALIDWGDGTSATSTVGTITGSSSNGFNVSLTKTYAAVGSYQGKVTISDTQGATTTSTFEVNVALAIGMGLTITPTAGRPFSGPVATFTTPVASQSPASYTASISWGDGQSSAGSIVANANGGTFTVIGAHTYASSGSDAVVATITGPG